LWNTVTQRKSSQPTERKVYSRFVIIAQKNFLERCKEIDVKRKWKFSIPENWLFSNEYFSLNENWKDNKSINYVKAKGIWPFPLKNVTKLLFCVVLKLWKLIFNLGIFESEPNVQYLKEIFRKFLGENLYNIVKVCVAYPQEDFLFTIEIFWIWDKTLIKCHGTSN
jgi:hypothetical protein